MADNFPTTSQRDAEAYMSRTPGPSLAVAAFGALITALEGLIDAERDLAGCGGGDPAVAAWLGDVDRALEAVHAWTAVLEEAPRQRPGDGRLQIVGGLIGATMRCAAADDLARLMGLAGARRGLFHLPADAPAAGWMNALVDAALDRLQVCVALAERAHWPAEDPGSLPDPEAQGTDPEGGLSLIC